MLIAMPRAKQNFAQNFPKKFPDDAKAKKKAVPFPFILDALAPLEPQVRPMFSGYAVYIGERIVFILRDRPNLPRDNGLWVVFSESVDVVKRLRALRVEFPSLRRIELLHGAIKHWLIIPMDGPNFESESLLACERVLANDDRFGRVPQSRRKKSRT